MHGWCLRDMQPFCCHIVYIKLNMQIIRDGAHHHAHYLVLTLHVSGISPPRKVLNQRELLSYLQVKVSGQNKRTLVQQAEKKHE